jgi:hypothetical protein
MWRKNNMPNFATMNGDKVSNIIIADTLEDAQSVSGQTCIEYDPTATETYVPAGIGFTWNGEVFIAPTLDIPSEPEI